MMIVYSFSDCAQFEIYVTDTMKGKLGNKRYHTNTKIRTFRNANTPEGNFSFFNCLDKMSLVQTFNFP